ncbi:hypothetical protein RCL1_006606 [Eukaryota sp. TZLM3-RCL]
MSEGMKLGTRKEKKICFRVGIHSCNMSLFQDSVSDFDKYLKALANEHDLEPNYDSSIEPDTFASLNNLESCISFVNSALSSLGLPSPLSFFDPSTNDVIDIVNAFHGLLQLRQEEIRRSEDLETRISRLVSEKQSLHTHKKILQKEISTTKSQLASVEEKLRRLRDEHDFLFKRAANDREAYNKTIGKLEQRDAQQTHQLKRLELQTSKLQNRLDSMIRNASVAQIPSVTVSQPLREPPKSPLQRLEELIAED